MKNLIKPQLFKHAFLLIALTLSKALVWAQDSTSTATTTTATRTETQTWYAEPWVWIVGGIVLLLIIVLLVRGNSSSSSTSSRTDKVTVTKTTEVE